MNIVKKFFLHNWLASIYLNFKILPFCQAIKMPIDIYHGIRFENLSGRIIISTGNLYRGMIKIGSQGSEMFPHDKSIIAIEGDWIIKGKVVLGVGSLFRVEKNGKLIMGENTILGAYNRLICEKEITLEKNTLSSWDCQIMDTDRHVVTDIETGISKELVSPIFIGSHTWIGNGVTINKGTRVPANSIIASKSLLNKDYCQAGEYCIFAGTPAKVVSTNKSWRI